MRLDKGIIEAIFITASNQTGVDTRSMTRRSIKVGIRTGEYIIEAFNEMSCDRYIERYGTRH